MAATDSAGRGFLHGDAGAGFVEGVGVIKTIEKPESKGPRHTVRLGRVVEPAVSCDSLDKRR
jgi:hypothetical protein